MFFLLLFLPGVAGAAGKHDILFTPISMESAVIQPFRHGLEVRLDLAMDNFKATAGTETLNGLFTRARPSIDYRYAPAKNTEFLLRFPYTAQGEDLTNADGKRVASRYSAGASAPTIAVKTLLGRRIAVAFRTRPPTAASRDPRLGDGVHYGADFLYKRGVFHLALGHTARLPYALHTSTGTHLRNPGDVDELSIALTSRDLPSFEKHDFVGPLMELHLIHADADRLDGEGVSGSAALTGKALFGFVLGKINRRSIHLTRVAVAAGVGDVLHKTEDPVFGAGDFQLFVGYALLWGSIH